MSIELLNEDRFGLCRSKLAVALVLDHGVKMMCTFMFVVQSSVMLLIREPDTPGGFNASIACKAASRSATGEDMMKEEGQNAECVVGGGLLFSGSGIRIPDAEPDYGRWSSVQSIQLGACD
jgi:hypothetical protein